MKDASEAMTPERSIHPSEWVRIALVALGALATWLGLWKPTGKVDLLAIAIALVGAWPILREALSALLARKMTMELSMSIAIVAAFAIGEAFTGLVIILFVLVAEVLEHLTIGRGRTAIANLLELLPRQAIVFRGGETVELPISRLSCGEIVLVRPGARLPIDGTVVSGHSFVDQSAITGESIPVEKVHGGRVYAGTINQSGTLQIETTGIGPDTAFGKIIRAVEEAEKSRAPIQRTADRLAGFLVYFAIGAAAVTFLATGDVRSTIAVVIVAGACGVAAGTPLAILGAIGRGARLGAIVKGGRHLEALGRVDTIVLDKTGTLTLGRPKVAEIIPCPGVTAESIVRTAAIAERPSEHPVARSILDQAKLMRLDIHEAEVFQYSPGGGITCRAGGEDIVVGSRAFLSDKGMELTDCPTPAGHLSEVWVARKGCVLGVIGIADVLRLEAHEAVQTFKRLGLKTVLLTGDSSAVAAAIGKQLGVDDVRAELLPDQKLAAVRVLAATGRRVAVVGDGINDAPALMAADVGIAMGSGTDIAQESAGILLLGDDLMVLVKMLRIARRCRGIIMQNFYGTLLVDSLGILFAALGLLTPLWAAFIHVSSELAFILNSTRLLPRCRRVSDKEEERGPRAILPTKLNPARLP
jgi:Cd2+/Zn2+-exporting ATPase/Cu+-exporting ATPase